MTTKSKSLDQIKKFALIRLSTIIYALHKEETLASISKRIRVNASALSSIKNDKGGKISLNLVLLILQRLDVEYTFTESYRFGCVHYSFEQGGYGYFGRSDTDKVTIIKPDTGKSSEDNRSLKAFLDATQPHA